MSHDQDVVQTLLATDVNLMSACMKHATLLMWFTCRCLPTSFAWQSVWHEIHASTDPR